MTARILFGGTCSGVGKTTVVTAVLAALRQRGVDLAPFKVGPDYIDPGFLAAAAARPAGNLDSWMCPPDQVLEVLARRAVDGSLVVIEGVMGLYDGRKGRGEEGSTAQVAKITSTPVILVADGARMARSASAMVGGYVRFDPGLRFAGVIFNRVGGESHYRLLREAVAEYPGLAALGYLPKDLPVSVAERHLGLTPACEVADTAGLLEALACQAEATLDLDGILAAAAAAGPLPLPARQVFPPEPLSKSCRIAVARDKAFHFYYPENLEMLAAYGAEIVFFSPLADSSLPDGTGGVYLGGGFPELFAQELSANTAMRECLAAAARDGMPVYAECGGYLYLAQELQDFEGRVYPMAGVFRGRAVMQKKRRALGYVEVSAAGDNFLLPGGETCRGHEFHWSDMSWPRGAGAPLYRRLPGNEPCGEIAGNCAGSYIHLHFLSNPGVARRFTGACRQYAARKEGNKNV